VPQFKIIFFDIDWTLYDHKNHCWPASALASLKELSSKGIKLVLCTARPYHSMDLFGVNKLGIVWDGYIASAGGIAFADGQYLRKSLMDGKVVEDFIAFVKSHKLNMELVEPVERRLLFKQTYSSRKFYHDFHESIPAIRPFEGEEVVGINFFAPKKWDEAVCALFPQLVYRRYHDYAVDVMASLHLKGEGVDSILAHYGIKKEEALGFGDDLQDLSLAEHVGSFVAMGNGKDEVKQAASFVTDPVWEDGLQKGLAHFSLVSGKAR
jgi:Cof subfamily protein (haloacid dehalogenase superfamily)